VGVRIVGKREPLGLLPWESVRALTADSRESLERRFGNGSIALIGVVAILANQTVSYVVVEDDQGRWVFAVPGLSAIELSSGLTHLQKFVPERREPPAPPTQAPADGVADRLRRLEALRLEGVITEPEYHDRRNAILADL
jgi:hypothetical protein